MLLAGVMLFAISAHASACMCEPEPASRTIKRLMKTATVIFTGTASETGRDIDGPRFRFWAKLKVKDAWKIDQQTELTIGTGGGCMAWFEVGKTYLVYADSDSQGRLNTNVCMRTRSIERSEDDLEQLGKPVARAPQMETNLRGRIVAYDKFQGLTNPREPSQLFIAQLHHPAKEAGGRPVKLVYFPETMSIRGGAKFLTEDSIKFGAIWQFNTHIPASEKEKFACGRFDNFFRFTDGTIDEDEKHEPILRFRSTQFAGDVIFDDLASMPCYVLDSLAR